MGTWESLVGWSVPELPLVIKVLSKVLSHVSILRETRGPALPLSGVDSLTSPWSSSLLSQGMPGQTMASWGLAIWPVSTLAALSRVVRTLPGPAARPTQGGLGGCSWLLLGALCPEVGAARPFLVPRSGHAHRPLSSGGRLSREKEPCARAGPVP